MLRLVLIFAIAAAVLQACIIVPVPPVWDIDNPGRLVGEVEVGQTEEDVIDLLGEPSVRRPIGFNSNPERRPSGTDLVYRGTLDEMAWCFGAGGPGYAMGDCQIDEEDWSATITIDENGIVTKVESTLTKDE
jgi:hypothetical protein